MAENRSSTVQQPIGGELDARFDHPSECTIMVIADVGDEKWIVREQQD